MKYKFCLFIVLLNITVSQAQSISDLLKVKDAIDKLEEFFKYKDYAEGVMKDVENGNEPRKPPSNIQGGENLDKRISNVLQIVKQIKIPKKIKFDAISTPVLDAVSDDLNIRRNAYRKTVNYFIEYNLEFKKYKERSNEIESAINRTAITKKAARVLANSFARIADQTGSGYTEISKLFGFAFFELNQRIIPKIGSIERLLKTKKKELDGLLKSESKKLDNLFHNLLTLLNEKRAKLKNEIQLRKKEFEELEIKANTLNEEVENNELEKKELAKQQNSFTEKRSKLLNDSKKTEAKSSSYNKKVDNFNKLRKRVERMKYTGCPNGNSFKNCTTHITQKNTYIKKKNKEVGKVNKAGKQLDILKKDIVKSQQSLKKN